MPNPAALLNNSGFVEQAPLVQGYVSGAVGAPVVTTFEAALTSGSKELTEVTQFISPGAVLKDAAGDIPSGATVISQSEGTLVMSIAATATHAKEKCEAFGPVRKHLTAPNGFPKVGSPENLLWVVVPGYSTERPLGPCNWAALHGITLPKANDKVLIAFDEENFPVVVWWEGEQEGGGGTTYEGKPPIKVSGTKIELEALGVTEGYIGAGAIVASKIGAEAVETAALKNLNVTEGKLVKAVQEHLVITGGTSGQVLAKSGSGAEYEWKTISGSVYTGKAPIKVTGTEVELEALGVTEGYLGAEAVSEGKIKALAVTAGKLGAESVTTAKIKLLAVTEATIAAEAVGASKLGSEAVETAKIKNLAVTAAKLGAESVETTKIKLLAVTEALLAAEAVVAGKIAKEAVTTEKLKEKAVTGAKIAANTIEAGNLKGEAVEAAAIAAGAVTEAKIGAEAVAEGKIKGEAVTAGKIATGAVTEAKLGSEAVTTGKLHSEAVEESKIKGLAVTTGKIAAEAVTEAKIGSEVVTNAKVKKEGLEPNRLEKEQLQSAQVKQHGLTVDRLKEGELTSAYAKTGGGILLAANNLSDVESTGTTKYNLHNTILSAAAVVATTNQASLEGLKTIDGATPESGQFVLLTAQTEAKNNGVWEALAGAWKRPKEFPEAGTITFNGARLVPVSKGTLYAGSLWLLEYPGATITIGVTAQTWTQTKTGTTYTAGEGLELSGTAFKVKALGVTTAMLAEEAVTNAKVKKESLEPNRLKPEELVSAQVKQHGLTIDRLKEGELTNAYVKAAAGIEESKLSIPEMVKLTETQTITGTKKFEPPAREPAEKGSAGTEPIKVVAGAGGEATSEENAKGGTGGAITITGGKGGKGAALLSLSTGGPGGKIAITSGAGGTSASKGIENVGGAGGALELVSGAGGTVEGAEGGERRGGSGGFFRLKAAGGGNAIVGAGTRVGGGGGSFEMNAGGGGEGSTEGGPGGNFIVEAGSAGAGGVATGGAVNISGGSASTAALSGAIILKTGTAPQTERLKITGTGVIEAKGELKVTKTLEVGELLTAKKGLTVEGATTTAKNGLTVEGTLTLPAESIAEAAIKAEAIATGKLAKALKEEIEKGPAITVPVELGKLKTAGELENTTTKNILCTAFFKCKAAEEAHTVKLEVEGKTLPTIERVKTIKAEQTIEVSFMLKPTGKVKATLVGVEEGAVWYQGI